MSFSFLENVALFFKVRAFTLKDLFKTIFLYWLPHPRFLCADCAVLLSYFFKSPYRIVKTFTKGKEPYGETPLVVMDKIVKRAHITTADTVFELGCGRGRTAFWLSCVVQCRVVGIELVPVFVRRAQKIARLFHLPRVCFIQGDMCAVDFGSATVIYLFGTCLDDAAIGTLITRLQTASIGTRIITVSYALTEYSCEPYIKLMDTFEVEFPWGITSAYIHTRV